MNNGAYELQRVFRDLYRKLRRETGIVLAQSELTNGDFRYISILAQRSGAQASEIAQEMGVQRGYITALTKRLEELKLVRRSKVRSDARASLLVLTSKGEKTFRALEEKVLSVLSNRIARLKSAETTALLGILRKMEQDEEEPHA